MGKEKDQEQENKKPVETQADYALINNGGIGPISIGISELRAKELSKVGVSPGARVTLYPGINKVNLKLWEVIREEVTHKIVTVDKWANTFPKTGMIYEHNFQSLKEEVRKKDGNKSGFKVTTESISKPITDYPDEEQHDIIKNCLNKNDLIEWRKEKDLPSRLYNLLSDQITELEKPPVEKV